MKFNLWLYQSNRLTKETQDLDQKLRTLVDNKFCYQLNQAELNTEFEFVSSMICKNDLKLEDFKLKIIEMLRSQKLLDVYFENLEEACDYFTNKIRLRVLKKQYVRADPSNKKLCVEKYRLKKALCDWHKTLKQLNLSLNEIDLAIQVLKIDDNLNQGLVILDCFWFNHADKSFSQYMEILWNINNGATTNSLKQAILKEFNLNPNDFFNMSVAKRLVEKYDWILIKEQKALPQADKGKKSKAGANASKTNLKQPPYNLDDGDIIAFFLLDPNEPNLNMESVTNQEFLTKFDSDLKTYQVDLEKLRKNSKKKSGGDAVERRSRRAEIGISIKTEDFS
jgi:hypothetical protein